MAAAPLVTATPKFQFYTAKGKREKMEDYVDVQIDAKTGCWEGLVCDGHDGSEVADWLTKNAPTLFLSILNRANNATTTTSPNNNMKKVLDDMQIRFMEQCRRMDETMYNLQLKGGSTLIAVGYMPRHDLYVTICVGDSRLVVGDADAQVVFATTDHKPLSFDEARHIAHTANGFVTKNGRVNGVLALSRAFGDWSLKNANPPGQPYRYSPTDGPVSVQPTLQLLPSTYVCHIVLASDGIWDVMSNEEVLCDIQTLEKQSKNKQPAKNKTSIPQRLVERADEKGSTDNMTLLLFSMD